MSGSLSKNKYVMIYGFKRFAPVKVNSQVCITFGDKTVCCTDRTFSLESHDAWLKNVVISKYHTLLKIIGFIYLFCKIL